MAACVGEFLAVCAGETLLTCHRKSSGNDLLVVKGFDDGVDDDFVSAAVGVHLTLCLEHVHVQGEGNVHEVRVGKVLNGCFDTSVELRDLIQCPGIDIDGLRSVSIACQDQDHDLGVRLVDLVNQLRNSIGSDRGGPEPLNVRAGDAGVPGRIAVASLRVVDPIGEHHELQTLKRLRHLGRGQVVGIAIAPSIVAGPGVRAADVVLQHRPVAFGVAVLLVVEGESPGRPADHAEAWGREVGIVGIVETDRFVCRLRQPTWVGGLRDAHGIAHSLQRSVELVRPGLPSSSTRGDDEETQFAAYRNGRVDLFKVEVPQCLSCVCRRRRCGHGCCRRCGVQALLHLRGCRGSSNSSHGRW
mmetsp:Transcript_90000/g.188167  ORF Transcript_90000/g.188167 Transcript_90000/m.188167 type:complete len:357 (-) Transcript_90000:98-1168(-)